MNPQKNTTLWDRLVGKDSEQPLEARIFHAVCILSVAALAFSVPFNLLIQLKELAFIMLVVCLLVLISYYYSRYKKKSHLNITLYGILSNLLFAVNFYYNSGIDGPTLMIFIASLFLIMAVVPPRQYTSWITLNIVLVLMLLLVQFKYPELITYTYASAEGRHADLFITYAMVVLLIYAITKYIRHHYNLEKRAVEQKAFELEKSNETKNKLLSIIAHDLRSPLNSIQSYLEVLSDAKLTQEEKKLIETDLLKKTQNTGQMLSNLLSWTRAQMEGVAVNLKTLNLADSLKATIQIQEETAMKKGIILKNDISGALEVRADVDMLEIIIRNILNNSIKFTQPGGEISISAIDDGTDIVITVCDNGKGISKSQQGEIFSLKGKSSYGTKNEKGAGLGLVLCKEFTEIQNGRIGFESEPGKGTKFFVHFKKPSFLIV
ncbi:MAG: sensor histidine kinase [Sphingobacteriaceae bacterium]|nr:sensor histidine kinase [Sphingobacteriaceae bacterium]